MPETGTVIVIGSGTMGTGIAQVAAMAGWSTHLVDVDPDIVTKAIDSVRSRLARLVEKGRLTKDAADAASACLVAGATPSALASASLGP